MSSDEKPTFGKKYTFFSKTHAINFQAVVSRQGLKTINIEVAPRFAGQQHGADWNKKITLQLSEVDLYKYFYCLTHKRLFVYESKFHGSNRNKSISFKESQSGCNISVAEKGNTLHFSCSTGEWFYAQVLMLEQLLGHPLSLSEAQQLMLVEKQ